MTAEQQRRKTDEVSRTVPEASGKIDLQGKVTLLSFSGLLSHPSGLWPGENAKHFSSTEALILSKGYEWDFYYRSPAPTISPSSYLGPERRAIQGNITQGPQVLFSCSHVTEQPESTNSQRGNCCLYYRKKIKEWNNLMRDPFSYITPAEPKLLTSEIQISSKWTFAFTSPE